MKTILNRQVLDTLPELVDPRWTALLVIDIQNDFCMPKGHFARSGKDVARMQPAVDRMVSFVGQAQALGMRTVFLRQASLPDGRMDSARVAALQDAGRQGAGLHHSRHLGLGVRRRPRGARRRLGGREVPSGRFHQHQPGPILRTQGIQSVILLGTTTEGCVESTVRAASYHDYYTVVVSDCVASPNAELHEGSLRFFRARYPTHTADEVLTAIRTARSAGGNA